MDLEASKSTVSVGTSQLNQKQKINNKFAYISGAL